MSQSLANDKYGRSVSLDTDGVTDLYSISGGGQAFSIDVPTGTPLADIYNQINANAPPSNPQIQAEAIEDKLQSYKAFGHSLIIQLRMQAESQGIQRSQEPYFYSITKDFLIACEFGWLEAAVSLVDGIPDVPPFITPELKAAVKNQINSFIGG